MATAVADARSHDQHSSESEKVPENEVAVEFSVIQTPSGILTPDPSDFSVKHPLQNRWTLWYDNPGKKVSQSSWGDLLKKIVTFETVEDFWCVFNNIVPPSKLPAGSNYHLFKEGIEPKWEDPLNARGGKWVAALPKKDREKVDDYWMYLILALIGESFDIEGEQICGIVVSLRKQQDKLALWTSDATEEHAVVKIGRTFKAATELPEALSIGYQAHEDALKHDRSFNNQNRYELI